MQELIATEHDQLFERVVQFVQQSHSKLHSCKMDQETHKEQKVTLSFDIRPHSREIPTAALLAGEVHCVTVWAGHCKIVEIITIILSWRHYFKYLLLIIFHRGKRPARFTRSSLDKLFGTLFYL